MPILKLYYLNTILALLAILSCQSVAANETPQSGAFLVRPAADKPYKPATLLKSDVAIEVSGSIAHVTVQQHFYNQSNGYVEGKYLFPLPEDAAVNDMEIHLDGRIIKGEIHEKKEARKIYKKARKQGKRAGLVEQERANLFTTQVANIAPQETIVVQISYVETIDRDGNDFRLHFPMTLTPRYTPEPVSLAEREKRTEEKDEGLMDFLKMPFAFKDEIPAEMANPVSLSVTINNADTIKALESTSHDIRLQERNDRYSINTKKRFVPMDRDFKLQWSMAPEGLADAGFYIQEVGGEYYGQLVIVPPKTADEDNILPRDLIFIIDTSGSMSGTSIIQAKTSLKYALSRLEEGQRFNIYAFNSDFNSLFRQSMPTTEDNVEAALEYVGNLHAGGGTEMAPVLREVLASPADPEYLRQIVFITDGAVSNEGQLFGIIHQMLGDSRLFTVGIGSAPNRLFMKKAAQFGRGTQTMVSKKGEVKSRMGSLFKQLEKPLMRDIQVDFPPSAQVEMYPTRIPDLYVNQPLVLSMKMQEKPESFTVRGNGTSPWQKTIKVKSGVNNPGVSTLWARSKIESLMDKIAKGGNRDTLKQEVIGIALNHRLVSQFTSFVAVEKKVNRPANKPLHDSPIANLMPDGSTMGKKAGYPQTAAGSLFWLISGLALLLLFFVMQAHSRLLHRQSLAGGSSHGQA